jgi:8-oxo-dGTP pyrophosphatase MutT (NUDIX family)
MVNEAECPDPALSPMVGAGLVPVGNSGSQPGSLADAMALIGAALLPEHREASRRRVLDFCRRHGDALHRSCRPGHLTASGFVVDPDAGKVLLIRHRKLDRWLQPGGHADGDGLLGRVAYREIVEETGLDAPVVLKPAFDIDIHAIPARGSDPEHLHLDLRFVAVASSAAVLSPNHETRGARWLTPGDGLLNGDVDVAEPARRALALAAEQRLGRFLQH